MRLFFPILFSLLYIQTVSGGLYDHTLTHTPLRSASELDYPPLAIVSPDGKADGFSVELLQHVVRAMGGSVTFEVDTWAAIKKKLAQGEIDVLPLVGRTPERERYFDFTIPYLELHGTVIVRKYDGRIKKTGDLQRMNLMVMRGDNTQEYLTRKKIGKTVIPYDTYEAALRALASGEHDAVVVQKLVGIQLIKRLHLDNLEPVNFILEDFRQDFSFAVREGDKKRLALLNEGLAIVIADGTYQQLYEKWLYELESPPEIDPKIVRALLFVLVLLAGVIIGFYIWQKMLKRQVTKKTRELDELNRTLEKRIDQAITQLHQKDELMIAQSRQAAMGEMIAMIAHQWRQPLTVIAMAVNNVQLSIELEEELRDDALLKMTDTVTKQTKHLSQTIDDFRNFFKPNQERVYTSVGTVMESTMKIIGKSLENHNIAVTIDDESLHRFHTYPNELLQVFINILNNAKDALKNKENSRITVIIRETETGAVTTICDNGGGLPENVISHIGEPYFTTKQHLGTGLGIYMSKTIVEQHLGGVLTWENRAEGACFIITLFKE